MNTVAVDTKSQGRFGPYVVAVPCVQTVAKITKALSVAIL